VQLPEMGFYCTKDNFPFFSQSGNLSGRLVRMSYKMDLIDIDGYLLLTDYLIKLTSYDKQVIDSDDDPRRVPAPELTAAFLQKGFDYGTNRHGQCGNYRWAIR
jgi:hypothetical protein